MKRKGMPEIKEPQINLEDINSVELDNDIKFSIGIPIELMFSELKDDMLQNVNNENSGKSSLRDNNKEKTSN